MLYRSILKFFELTEWGAAMRASYIAPGTNAVAPLVTGSGRAASLQLTSPWTTTCTDPLPRFTFTSCLM
ncbi:MULTISPECIES: hypothetical protein [Nitrosomonas]|uniref:Uncharacterized protein n=1 Tax=Nitrosomonas communis TaxID=44574 RepID=A0A0F7KJI5_9PROT|nr:MULTISPECIES: hypothetical protein [Nitrosomonas]AKH39114.1 hypothetical protein AAW31_16895 [Nitrosomonas communis]TYP91250.1 hypothetical protein BCL69_101021 [Nitrosomonas communis]UVS61287.1 hypothetical protein NX761_17705 [Nitrosomonas sp. PLL12]